MMGITFKPIETRRKAVVNIITEKSTGNNSPINLHNFALRIGGAENIIIERTNKSRAEEVYNDIAIQVSFKKILKRPVIEYSGRWNDNEIFGLAHRIADVVKQEGHFLIKPSVKPFPMEFYNKKD